MHEIQRTIEEEITRKTKAECQQQFTELRETIRKIKQSIAGLQKENRDLRVELDELKTGLPKVTPRGRPPIPRVSGESIVRLRKRLGLSGTDLALFFGVTLVTVSRWEHGEQELRPVMRQKVGELRKLGKRAVRQVLAEKKQNFTESKKA